MGASKQLMYLDRNCSVNKPDYGIGASKQLTYLDKNCSVDKLGG